VVQPKPPVCSTPFTAATHPLSALNAPLVHTGHHTHDGGSARAGQTLGSACLDPDGQERLGGGRTVGVQSEMMDRDSSALSTARFAGCLRVVSLPR
jgi:hypothetical protein